MSIKCKESPSPWRPCFSTDQNFRKNFIQEGHDGPGSLTRVIFPKNGFYISVPLVPTSDPRGGASFDPTGHHMNKIDKGLQGDATYQKSMLYPFQCQRRRILKLVFFLPMFQLVTPVVGSVFTQRNHMNKIDKGPQRNANNKYQSSNPSSFREEF